MKKFLLATSIAACLAACGSGGNTGNGLADVPVPDQVPATLLGGMAVKAAYHPGAALTDPGGGEPGPGHAPPPPAARIAVQGEDYVLCRARPNLPDACVAIIDVAFMRGLGVTGVMASDGVTMATSFTRGATTTGTDEQQSFAIDVFNYRLNYAADVLGEGEAMRAAPPRAADCGDDQNPGLRGTRPGDLAMRTPRRGAASKRTAGAAPPTKHECENNDPPAEPPPGGSNPPPVDPNDPNLPKVPVDGPLPPPPSPPQFPAPPADPGDPGNGGGGGCCGGNSGEPLKVQSLNCVAVPGLPLYCQQVVVRHARPLPDPDAPPPAPPSAFNWCSEFNMFCDNNGNPPPPPQFNPKISACNARAIVSTSVCYWHYQRGDYDKMNYDKCVDSVANSLASCLLPLKAPATQ